MKTTINSNTLSDLVKNVKPFSHVGSENNAILMFSCQLVEFMFSCWCFLFFSVVFVHSVVLLFLRSFHLYIYKLLTPGDGHLVLETYSFKLCHCAVFLVSFFSMANLILFQTITESLITMRVYKNITYTVQRRRRFLFTCDSLERP